MLLVFDKKYHRMSKVSYFSDGRLLQRVREYLLESNGHPASPGFIADRLQNKYREYERKKKNAFQKLVERACIILSEEEGLETTTSNSAKKRKKDRLEENSDSESFSSDIDEYIEYQDTSYMNSMVADLYKKGTQSGGRSKSKTAHSPSIGSQQPALGRNLFAIDKNGDKEIKAKYGLTPTNENKIVVRKDGSDVRRIVEQESPFKKDNCDVIDEPSFDNDVIDIDPSSEEVTEPPPDKPKRGKKRANNTDVKQDKPNKKVLNEQVSSVTFANVGGNENTLQEVCKLLVHLKHPEVYRQLGVTPPRGFLLHGPPGCGKTLLAHAIAGELELPFIKLAATEIVSGVSGESEQKVRDIFEQAVDSSPCVLFFDEIDAITQKRDNASKDMERRIVAQLLACMDDLNSKPDVQVIVIGATNREDSLDPALRRAGRFDKEICMGIPNEKARMGILEVLCRPLRLSADFDLLQIARLTPGFVGADLMALTREAAITAVNRVFAAAAPGISQLSPVSSQPDKASTPQPNSRTIIKGPNPTNHATPNQITETRDQNSMDVVYLDASADSIISEDKAQLNKSNPDKFSESMNMKTTLEGSSAFIDVAVSLPSVLDWLRDSPPLSSEQLANMYITMADFRHACKHVQPSSKREGFATIPDVTWEDIGALAAVREELNLAILAPVRHPEQFQALGITSPAGVLLVGPPGCGKTLLAKAVANESGLNFISVKGPELLNMYVGESERAVRQVFTRARNSAPCVIFFDELDALCPKRSGNSEGNSSARVVNQLLTEMDGLEERRHVFIMGATNRPDILDPAVMRPGRLDRSIYVGLPTPEDRLDILLTLTKKGTRPPLTEDVNLEEIANEVKCNSYTGADLSALVREASVLALKEYMSKSTYNPKDPVLVHRKHFTEAIEKVKPSVSTKDQEKYERMKQIYTMRT